MIWAEQAIIYLVSSLVVLDEGVLTLSLLYIAALFNRLARGNTI